MAGSNWKHTKLGGEYTIEDFDKAKALLTPKAFSDEWEELIAAIETRFSERFIRPAKAIQDRDFEYGKRFVEGRGFAILALDCLLIESLVGYRQGFRTKKTAPAFKDFLTSEPAFKPAFEEKGRAASFADAVRNGILHDGETREGWIVKLGRAGGPLLGEPLPGDKRTTLNRNAFHHQVTRCFQEYFASLRDQSARGWESREKFKKRVTQLCEQSDPEAPVDSMGIAKRK